MSGPCPMFNYRDFKLAFEGESAAEVLPSWQKLMSEKITRMEILPNDINRPFRASWRHLDMGELSLNIIHSPSQQVIHDIQSQSFKRSGSYDLLYMTENYIRLSHCGREELVPEGSFILVDNTRSFSFEAERENKSVTMHFSEAWINRWIPDLESLIGKPISGFQGWSSPLGALLKTISTEGLDDLYVSRSVLGDQIGSLMSLLPGQSVDRRLSGPARAILTRIQEVINEHFTDADFSPDRAASVLGISKRHLHGTCARAGTTFSSLLMDARLKKAREKLDDRRYSGHRVYDIAFSCGFSDPSHFARRFRAAFGFSPKSYGESRTSPDVSAYTS